MLLLKQNPLCSAVQLNCTKKIEVEFSKCLPPCSGLVVSSFSKSESNKKLEDLVYNEIVSYEKYTKWSPFPGGLKGCQIFNTRKKAAAKPTHFSGHCGQRQPNLSHFWQLVYLCPTCLFYSLRHGRLGLIEVFPFLSFFYSPRSSLWSLRVFPLVIKIPHLHLHSFEVKCDERTNERTYGPDGITNHVCY